MYFSKVFQYNNFIFYIFMFFFSFELYNCLSMISVHWIYFSIFISLFLFIIGSFFGRFIGFKGLKLLIIIFAIFNSIVIIKLFTIIPSNFIYLTIYSWFFLEFFSINFGFIIDSLTISMLLIINVISTCVLLYSTEYMKGDPHIIRFLLNILLFTFFMNILVTSDNFLQLFIGWEGVGVCSYLLIGFWHTRIQANKAAIKAMLMNRIGDMALVICFMFIFFEYGSLEYEVVFAQLDYFYYKASSDTIFYIILLLLFGAVGKSAQIGLHTWLPDAMEGPTPVSALIHAATMVTAGVFLLVRCSSLLEYNIEGRLIVLLFGGFTAFFAGTVGCLQNDIKKIIAYSTCSQLGYMVFSCGLSGYDISMYHLLNHAFFKALLFLCAGCVIHSLGNEQDLRNMGGLYYSFVFIYTLIFVGSLALEGFPFLSGFYSKDLILELAQTKYTLNNKIIYFLGSFSALTTTFYSTRLLLLSFFSKPKNNFKSYIKDQNNIKFSIPFFMWSPLICLLFGTFFFGFITNDMFVGRGTAFWGNSIIIHPYNFSLIESHFINYNLKIIPLISTFIGFFIACLFFYINVKKQSYNLIFFITKKWYFDIVYNYISKKIIQIARQYTFVLIDKGILEFFGPFGLSRIFNKFLFYIKITQNGLLFTYSFFFFFSIFSIIYCIFIGISFKFFFIFILLYFFYF